MLEQNVFHRPRRHEVKARTWLEEHAELREDGLFFVPPHLHVDFRIVKYRERDEMTQAYWSDPENVWNSVSTFEDLRATMDRYLRDLEPDFPWWDQNVDLNSLAATSQLIRLNELGFIPIDAQQGDADEFMRRRAFVRGLVQDSAVEALREMASAEGFIWAENRHQELPPVSAAYPLTELASGDLLTSTAERIAYPAHDDEYHPKGLIDVLRSCTTVGLADPEWNSNRLYAVMIPVMETHSS